MMVIAASLHLSGAERVVSLDITVNNGTTHALTVSIGHDDFGAVAARFVEDHSLQYGAGCQGDTQCVARNLVAALERAAVEDYSGLSLGPLATTFGAAPLFSGCGWHESGDPFAAQTPGPAATARSTARMASVASHLEPFKANASVALRGLHDAAARRRGQGTEQAFDILHVPRSAAGACSGDPAASKITLAIGIISAPGNLAHRMAIR
jgi:hypothetical protein